MSLCTAALLEQTFLNSQLAGGPQQPRLTLNLGPVSPRRPYVRSKGRKFERQRPAGQRQLQKLTRVYLAIKMVLDANSLLYIIGEWNREDGERFGALRRTPSFWAVGTMPLSLPTESVPSKVWLRW